MIRKYTEVDDNSMGGHGWGMNKLKLGLMGRTHGAGSGGRHLIRPGGGDSGRRRNEGDCR